MKQKIRQKLLPLAIAITLACGGTIAISNPAMADPDPGITADTVTAEVEKFNIVNDGIVALIQSFTLVMIMPMGVRAGSQLFRHLVLSSL